MWTDQRVVADRWRCQNYSKRTELSPPTCNNTKLVNYGSFKFIHSHIFSFNKYILCINYKVLLEAWGIDPSIGPYTYMNRGKQNWRQMVNGWELTTGWEDTRGKREGAEEVGKARHEDVETNSTSWNCAEGWPHSILSPPNIPLPEESLQKNLLLSPGEKIYLGPCYIEGSQGKWEATTSRGPPE